MVVQTEVSVGYVHAHIPLNVQDGWQGSMGPHFGGHGVHQRHKVPVPEVDGHHVRYVVDHPFKQVHLLREDCAQRGIVSRSERSASGVQHPGGRRQAAQVDERSVELGYQGQHALVHEGFDDDQIELFAGIEEPLEDGILIAGRAHLGHPLGQSEEHLQAFIVRQSHGVMGVVVIEGHGVELRHVGYILAGLEPVPMRDGMSSSGQLSDGVEKEVGVAVGRVRGEEKYVGTIRTQEPHGCQQERHNQDAC